MIFFLKLQVLGRDVLENSLKQTKSSVRRQSN